MIRIAAVSYLNTLPFIYGLKYSNFIDQDELELVLKNPAECAFKLIRDDVDIALVPVGGLRDLPYYELLTDYCIGADGPVKTVALFSDVPINMVKRIYLDYQSMTSVLLLKVLTRKFWNMIPVWLDGFEGYEAKVCGRDAGLVIGDRAFEMQSKHRFVYDLAEEWKKFTGLSFVFACWVTNKRIPRHVEENFCNAIDFGIKNKITAVKQLWDSRQINLDAEHYITHHISYDFDRIKRLAMEKFTAMVKKL